MKSLLAALFILVGGIAFTSVLVHRPVVRPAPPARARTPVSTFQEHFWGSAETLMPAELRAARIRNAIEMREWNRQEEARQRAIDRRIAAAIARPHSLRLPADYRWGRCLLVVEGKTRMSGRCAYSIDKDGDFNIQGPRQIYGGIDFPKPEYGYEERSNDYWAYIYKEEGIWTGGGNDSIEETRVSGPDYGPLRRHGSCFTGRSARICLWKFRAANA